ncbi:MAG: MBL fold metallo-hydrolase [SAR202 cluster bacterium]|nr:MBL fold metallo-hydrolase [SAR202 cluster bacterium]
MAIRFTCYGGVGQIGGNKILLEDLATDGRLLLDFGTSFGDWGRYYEEYLKPRAGAGIIDLLETGLLPPLDGLYRDDLTQLPETPQRLERAAARWGLAAGAHLPSLRRSGRPPVDAVLLSHAHLDHSGYVGLLDASVPVVAHPLTATIAKAMQDTSGGGDFEREVAYFTEKVPLVDKASGEARDFLQADRQADYRARPFLLAGASHELQGFWDSPPGKKGLHGPELRSLSSPLGGLAVRTLPVDHSIFGAVAFLMETSAGPVAYTGDLRFHGTRGALTEEMRETLSACRPTVLIGEGTRAGSERRGSEAEVYENALRAAKSERGLLVADFAPRNVERLLTFLQIAKDTSRALVVLDKDAYLLGAMHAAAPDLVPDFASDGHILLYDDPRASIHSWQSRLRRKYSRKRVTADRVRTGPGDYILSFSFWDLKNLIDVGVYGGTYIYSSSEAHNEEQELDARRLQNWLQHFRLRLAGDPVGGEGGLHCSGHATGHDLVELYRAIHPRYLVPVHTENPAYFIEHLKGSEIEVRVPELGIPLEFD